MQFHCVPCQGALMSWVQVPPGNSRSIRIACRTAVWPAGILGPAFVATWAEAAVGVFELAPLRRRDVLLALMAHQIDPDTFVSDLFGAHSVPFAIKPLTLGVLIKIYQRRGSLPSSTAEVYRQGCLALAEEQNVSRRETRRLGQLNGPQRFRLACRVAGGTVIGGRAAVWTGPESDCPPGDLTISQLSGGTERGAFAEFTATDDDIREVLDTGLFSSRGDHRMGWAHQSYGEFLAALYLTDKQVSAPTIQRVLIHPSGGIIPQLAGVAAWTASLSAELRTSLIAVGPWELLRGDLANWAASDLELLTRSMLDHVEHGRYYEHFFGMAETYTKLAHAGLAALLRPFIVTPSLKITTRRVALNIAERCALTELEPEMLQVVLDSSDHHAVRAMAVASLRRCGTGSAVPQLQALARGEAGDDPQDEIKGYALDLLWPEHIGTAEVLSLLTPSDPNFFGGYAHFVFGLPARLRRQDLLPALEWATGYLHRSNLMGEFREKTFADAVMFRTWPVFEESDLTVAFVLHIETRLRQYGHLCRGTDYKANEAFLTEIRTDDQRRRLFLRARLAAPLDWSQASGLRRVGLLMPPDFAWLLSVAPGGPAAMASLDEGGLCNALDVLFARADGPEFESLYEHAQHWPALHVHFSWLLDGIELASDEAARARSHLAHELQLAEMYQRPPAPELDLPKLIRDCLERAEAGEWQAWWQMNVWLACPPENPNAGTDLDYIITEMPGWLQADEPVRRRIVTGSAATAAPGRPCRASGLPAAASGRSRSLRSVARLDLAKMGKRHRRPAAAWAGRQMSGCPCRHTGCPRPGAGRVRRDGRGADPRRKGPGTLRGWPPE